MYEVALVYQHAFVLPLQTAALSNLWKHKHGFASACCAHVQKRDPIEKAPDPTDDNSAHRYHKEQKIDSSYMQPNFQIGSQSQSYS